MKRTPVIIAAAIGEQHTATGVGHNGGPLLVSDLGPLPVPAFVPFGKPFQDRFGPARSTQAVLLKNGELRSVLLTVEDTSRGRRLIETKSWFEYVERQRQKEAAGLIGVASATARAWRKKVSEAPRRTKKVQVTIGHEAHQETAPAIVTRSAPPRRRETTAGSKRHRATAPPKKARTGQSA